MTRVLSALNAADTTPSSCRIGSIKGCPLLVSKIRAAPGFPNSQEALRSRLPSELKLAETT